MGSPSEDPPGTKDHLQSDSGAPVGTEQGVTMKKPVKNDSAAKIKGNEESSSYFFRYRATRFAAFALMSK